MKEARVAYNNENRVHNGVKILIIVRVSSGKSNLGSFYRWETLQVQEVTTNKHCLIGLKRI